MSNEKPFALDAIHDQVQIVKYPNIDDAYYVYFNDTIQWYDPKHNVVRIGDAREAEEGIYNYKITARRKAFLTR